MSDRAVFESFAHKLADAARAAILPYFRAAHGVQNKAKAGGFDPVTEADKAAEAAMRALIEAQFPDHGVLGEEFAARQAQSPYTWIIDPIDGTRAFIAGLPLWGVLIALAREGRPILGVIDQPYLGERYIGWTGGGEPGADLHTRDGVRALAARDCAGLNRARLATTDPNLFAGAEADAFAALRGGAQLTRFGYDCYAYAMVALGGLDVVAESRLAPWDVAALAPVVAGAGGSFTDWAGRDIAEHDLLAPATRVQALATGDARVRDEALALLAPAAK
jgi:myo-inositol-1(or 4)-monophosphatase